MSVKNKRILLLLGLIVLSILSMILAMYAFEYGNSSWIIYLIALILLAVISSALYKKFPNQIFKIISGALNFPIALVFALFVIAFPTMIIVGVLMFFIILCISAPIIFLRLNNFFEWVELMDTTKVFLVLVFGISIAVAFHKQVLFLTKRIVPLRLKTSRKMKTAKVEELIDYLLSKTIIRFLIYSGFFIYLALYSFFLLQNNSILENSDLDKAVFQSFVTFLAFDRILLNTKEIPLAATELLDKILTVIGLNPEETEETEEKAKDFLELNKRD